MDNLSSIGYNIRKKRVAKAWNQEQLAEKTNLSAAYIGMIERGEKIPRMETFIKITNALDTTADELLAGVIDRGYEIRTSQYLERIKTLSREEQIKVFKVLDAMLEK